MPEPVEPVEPENTADQARVDRYARLETNTPTLGETDFYQRSRRSLLVGGLAALTGFTVFRGIQSAELVDRAPKPLRAVHERNEALWRSLFREGHLAKEFDPSDSSPIRVNGRKGLDAEIEDTDWELQVQGPDGELLGTHSLADIQAFDKQVHTIEHKCIEGWSHVITWGGTRFADFAGPYRDMLGELPKFVSLETPDGGYYVGMDIETMLHPQTMLTFEMEGAPLDSAHGAPVRLTTPLKYGIKHIKRVGVIRFTNEQPADYWASRGYDWYSHL